MPQRVKVPTEARAKFKSKRFSGGERMSNVTIEWSTVVTDVVSTVLYTHYRVWMSPPDGGIQPPVYVLLNSNIRVVTFENVPPGSYIAHVALSNADGTGRDFQRDALVTVPQTTDTPATVTATI